MALAPPIIQDELLTYQQGDSTAQMAVGSAGWYAFNPRKPAVRCLGTQPRDKASIITFPTTRAVAERLREPEAIHNLPVPLTPLIGRIKPISPVQVAYS